MLEIAPNLTDSATRDELDTDQISAAVAARVLPPIAHQPGEVRRRYRSLAVRVALVDALCIVNALLLSYMARWGLGGMPVAYMAVVIAAPFVWVGIFQVFSLYSLRQLSAWEEFRRVINATSFGMVVLILTSYWLKTSFSRMWVAFTWIFVLLLELVARRAWRAYTHRLKVSGDLNLRTLIVGTNDEAIQINDRLSRPGSGFEPVGHIRVADPYFAAQGCTIVGNLDSLVEIAGEEGVDCLFVASTDVMEKEMLAAIQGARQQGIEVWVSANLPEVLSPRLRIQSIEDVLTLSLRPVRLSGPQAVLKRAFDLVVAGIGLMVVSPVLAAIAIAVKLDSRGPAFYRQARVTKAGQVFSMLKFRTMSLEADRILVQRGIDASAPFFKLGEDDPRLTRVGAFLRKWSLDELPQLINVIKGEMGLVGPRPLPARQVAENLDLLGPRHEVKAGMTGWWQVQGRSEVEDPEESVRLDLFYIENWSLALDVFILLKTVGVVLGRTGAR